MINDGDLKLIYSGLIEKAELKEKERVKEEQKRIKKLEHNFKNLLKKIGCNENSKYGDFKEKLQKEEAYLFLESDSERIRLFDEYVSQIQETCLHHIKRKKKKKN